MTSITHKIMNFLGRYRLITDPISDEPYMHRYYLFLKDRKWFPFNVVLHKVVKSDEPMLHDHPWAYMTIILKGGYWEHTYRKLRGAGGVEAKVTWRGPGSIIRRSAGDMHWLELDEKVGPATTLFFMGRQVRDWGFLTPDKGWVNYKSYIDYMRPLRKRLMDTVAAALNDKSRTK